MKNALITGITGQDGRYMAALLHEKGYRVFGLVHGDIQTKRAWLEQELPFVAPLAGDLADRASLIRAVELSEPQEIYNLAGSSFVAQSFQEPEVTADVTGLGVLRMLEAVRLVGGEDHNLIRMYQASSSEMFGKVAVAPQSEKTPFYPRSPYGVAKVFGHYSTVNYRESYGMYACSGICFNHESPYRGKEFVSRKITNGVARIKAGLQDELVLGNLDAERDWGYAGDYVQAMWMTLQQDEPEDFVLATGRTHSVRQLVETAFVAAGVQDGERYVRTDPAFMRPTDVAVLVGDATKAATVLGWRPEVSFEQLVAMMVEADLEEAAAEVRAAR